MIYPNKVRASIRGILALAVLALVVFVVGGQAAAVAQPECKTPSLGFDPFEDHGLTELQTTLGPLGFEISGDDCATTEWSAEWSASATGPWQPVPEGSGTIPAAGQRFIETGVITGLKAETKYWVRWVAKDAAGEETGLKEYETAPARPRTGFSSNGITEVSPTSAHVEGNVVPDDYETTWEVQYGPSGEGPWIGSGISGTIPQAEADENYHDIAGTLTGLTPSTTYYVRVFAKNAHGEAKYERIVKFTTGGPPSAATFTTHTFDGEIPRVLGDVTANGSDTHYEVEYVSAEQYAASRWADAERTSPRDAGATDYSENVGGFPTLLVGVNVPGMRSGTTYRDRLVASNASGTAQGTEQTLTVPVAASGGEPPCANSQLRTGLSAQLPDCRAYEQLTPVEKGGTMDIGTYGNVTEQSFIAEDGESLVFHAPGAQWGSSPDSKTSDYVFSRASGGWQMRSLTPQPQAGAASYAAQVFSANLTDAGLFAAWQTTNENRSATDELQAGPPGGPYTAVALVPAKSQTAWVGGSADGSTLVLSSEDRTLGGAASRTRSGADLYEYREGQLHQVNLTTTGAEIGSCGATLASEPERLDGEGYLYQGIAGTSASHAVAANGSRIVFEAVPGSDCEEAAHVYVRVDGSETLDVGAYRFLAANPQDTMLLLLGVQKGTGVQEVFEYDANTRTVASLFTVKRLASLRAVVSENLTAVYFESPEQISGTQAPPLAGGSEDLGEAPNNIYRYDLTTKTMDFIAQAGENAEEGGGYSVSPNGEFFYFASSGLGGVLGGGDYPGTSAKTVQVYRYDNAEGTIQCMSCVSAFNAEPRLSASFLFGDNAADNGLPERRIASDDGDYVFFETAAALVPQDVDGEIAPDPTLSSEHVEYVRSPSSDVYEWRKNGIDGCDRVQGCLSLITGGTGGYRNELLGTTPSGGDVFFITHEVLVGQDKDKAGDIYDARIGGGYPPPPPAPTECEGDACTSPPSPPLDATPASLSFAGPGNLLPPPVAKAKSSKLACPRGTKREKKKCVAVKGGSRSHGRARGKRSGRPTKRKRGGSR